MILYQAFRIIHFYARCTRNDGVVPRQQLCRGFTPIVLGGAPIADIIPPKRRGAAMTLWGDGQLFGTMSVHWIHSMTRWILLTITLLHRSLGLSKGVPQ